MQDGRAAKDDRGALCAGPEQHRQDTKKRVIADDDVDMDVAQDLLQRRVLQRNSVDEDVPRTMRLRTSLGVPAGRLFSSGMNEAMF